ncbi:YunG family protein [Phreatobacter sp. AB_2022a]|uniref:YunG family protein n=1 Tax=Phreatobacter sp. AB_2022a TaxID=3003134 RepID=UPI00228756CA|nr:hypothetical protein [Phreatobacter sp. AB_2022a]MCZ0737682.1 hypothetical protein [Phreatobacter sp. AB_2022a]
MPPALPQLLPILRACWSPETSSQWRPDNPARGQCNVTCLVVNDLYGGDILKTELPEGWHFYNRIAGERHDLTAGQFDTPPAYTDVASTRQEALDGTAEDCYATLKKRVEAALARTPT